MGCGIDVGRSGVKAVAGSRRLFLPAMAVPVPDHLSRDREGRQLLVEETDGLLRIRRAEVGYQGQRVVLGDELERLGHRSHFEMDVTKATSLTRLLLLAAAALLGESGGSDICVGLPVVMFEAQRQRLRALLTGTHDIEFEGAVRSLTLTGLVVPEGLGLLLTAASDGERLDVAQARRSTVVLDFGHRTTQVAIFRGMLLSPASTALHIAGTEIFERVLVKAVDEPLGRPHDPATHALMAQDLCLDGRVTVYPLTLTLEELMPQLKAQAATVWQRMWGEISRALTGVLYERVVAGGGGATLFHEQLVDTFGERLVLLPDRFGQAEGYAQCIRHRAALTGR